MDKSTAYLSNYISQKGYNLRAMANELGISYDTLYNSLGKRGKRPLRGDELLAICNFIGMNPKDIYSVLEENESWFKNFNSTTVGSGGRLPLKKILVGLLRGQNCY